MNSKIQRVTFKIGAWIIIRPMPGTVEQVKKLILEEGIKLSTVTIRPETRQWLLTKERK